jgi:hypothetical protein
MRLLNNLSNKHKRDIVRFALGGIAAVLIKNIAEAANKKAESLFPDSEDEDKTQN